MALAYAKIEVNQIEVDLKNKPQEMIRASAKATVPVLVLEDGHVIDESIDIMKWALKHSDPDGWLRLELQNKCDVLIKANDFEFKPLLDHYKYPQKSEMQDPIYYRDKAQTVLNSLNSLLMQNKYLLADHISLADSALAPFIRQFYMVDPQWFRQNTDIHLLTWLDSFLSSELFLSVMEKPIKN